MIEVLCQCDDLGMPAHSHRRLSWIERVDDGRRSWVPSFVPQVGYRVIAEVEDVVIPVDWKALYRLATQDVGLGICSLCERRPATTTWAFPVCQSCADTLTLVDKDLQAMEVEDPELAELRRAADDALRLMIRCCGIGPDSETGSGDAT